MIKVKLIRNAKRIDKFLINYLKKQDRSLLINPMKYGIISGGKKIRSAVILSAGKIFNLNQKKLINICASVECIHSYSLIHDDLPCMDDDSIRRGKPSTHIKFGEASAVLAGNSLLTLAFEMIADKNYRINSKSKSEIIKSLAFCSGHTGIAGGQELDLKFENKKKSLSQIISMQKKKTGKLFSFCCAAPAIIKNKSSKEIKFFENIGLNIGLLFQISDDLIDFRGDSKKAGKKTGKDQKKGKATLISLLGYRNAIKYCDKIIIDINKNLKKYGSNSKNIKETLDYIINRDK